MLAQKLGSVDNSPHRALKKSSFLEIAQNNTFKMHWQKFNKVVGFRMKGQAFWRSRSVPGTRNIVYGCKWKDNLEARIIHELVANSLKWESDCTDTLQQTFYKIRNLTEKKFQTLFYIHTFLLFGLYKAFQNFFNYRSMQVHDVM